MPKFRPRIFDLQNYEAETLKAMRAAAGGPRRLKFGMGPQGGSLQQICVRQDRMGIFKKSARPTLYTCSTPPCVFRRSLTKDIIIIP